MRVAIHQPNFLPYPGFFDKLALADAFILLDTVQFVKNGWQNRNRVKGPTGAQWLTVPIRHKHGQLIKDVQLAGNHWSRKATSTLYQLYRRAPYYEYIRPVLAALGYNTPELSVLNSELIKVLRDALEIKTPIVTASDFAPPPQEDPTGRLVWYCQQLSATHYISGPTGKTYLDGSQFEQAGIDIVYQQYQPPTYPQRYGDFVPGLAVVDLLANCGPQSRHVLISGRGDNYA